MSLSRRDLLLVSAASAVACGRRGEPGEHRPPPVHPGSPFSQLTRALGPWPLDAREGREIADAFQRGQAPKPPEGVDLAQLAARCLEARKAKGAIDVAALSEIERTFVLDFAAALYRIPDVLAALTGSPPEGACSSDPLAYTRAPG